MAGDEGAWASGGQRPRDQEPEGQQPEGLADPGAPWEELIEDPDAPRRLLAVLFTDIVGSTELVSAFGDKRWRELLEQHDAAIRAQLARFGGTEVDTAGDAFFATFELPVRAVDCALESARAVRRLGLQIRAGVHMGECMVSNGAVRGLTVHIGARVAAKARGDEVLVSSTVRDVLAGAGLKFGDRGEQTLKGVDGRWRIYAVEPRERDDLVDLPPLLEAGIAKPVLPRWKRRRTRVAVAIMAVLVLAGVIAFVASRTDKTGVEITSVAADSIAALDASSGKVSTTVSVGRRPVGLAATPGGVWVANSIDRSLALVSRDGTAVATIGPVGAGPSAVVPAGNLIWVANADGHSISRVSPQTKTTVGEPIETGNGLSDMSFGAGAMWITNAVDGTVWKIDPASGKATRKTQVAPALRGIVARDDAVWTVSESAGTLTQLDPKTAAVIRVVQVGNGPRAVTVGNGAVWVANAFDGTVSRVAGDRGKVTATIRVGAGPRAIAFARGHVFVANETDGTVTMIDAASNKVLRTIRLQNSPMGLAADGDRVWVSVRGGILRYKGGTLRVGVPVFLDRPETTTFDPRFNWNPFGFAITSATHDGLVAYKKVGGLEGGVLVPDLAEEILPPADGGRTYTFRLRPNLRYSDGSKLLATDVRTSFERQFLADARGLVLFGSIAGTEKCSPKACDLAAGIVTDDTARTVTFHLKRPNPDFAYILGHPLAVILPPGTPAKDARLTPIPGTGPYMLAEAKGTRAEGKALLTRNPYFRARGAAAPDGYPDRIEVSWGGSPDDHLAKVKAGTEDWSPYSGEASESLEQLSTEVPAQFHLFDQQSVSFATLNQNTPPFNDVRVRRAVNFAVDRRAMAAASGEPLRIDVTCQILPKDIFGYAPYCPYTLRPGAAGVWTAPDLVTARRLVAESGTRGQRVSISFQEDAPRAPSAKVLAAALRQLGYRVTLNPLPADELFGHALDSPGYQSMLDGWIGDYPSASTFFVPLLSCPATVASVMGVADATVNEAHFCSKAADRQITDALVDQQKDLLGAVDSWAAVDRAITDAAPWVPYATFRTATVVSSRVGNVLLNPGVGILMTQMWLTHGAR